MSASTDLCHNFAGLFADASYEDIPPAAIEVAKKSILDTIGVILGGSGMEPAARRVAEVVLDNGGRPESTVLGFGSRAPAAMAAFANGAMAHCLDFDDRTSRGAHPSSSIVPAVFALAERKGGVSGRRIIAAVAAGHDMFVRLRFNVEWRQDWNPSTVFGVFSAAGAAAHVLGLDHRRVSHALGIASMQSTGTMQLIYGTGSDLRGLYAGFSAMGAVLAAQLAEKGITGIDNLFEGKAGILNVFFWGDYDRAGMLENLGKDYLGATLQYKPWPAVGVSHTYIHATIQLMKQHGLAADDIAQIRVYVGDYHQRMCTPLEARQAPVTAVDAKFSLPFVVAIAAVRGDVGITDFTNSALLDKEVLAMARKVIPVADSSMDWKAMPPDARIEVVIRDGRIIEGVGRSVPGSPEAPMSWDDVARKFRNCARAAAVPVAEDRIERAVNMVARLETVEDATDLLRVLS